jgi:hypothetical protein
LESDESGACSFFFCIFFGVTLPEGGLLLEGLVAVVGFSVGLFGCVKAPLLTRLLSAFSVS